VSAILSPINPMSDKPNGISAVAQKSAPETPDQRRLRKAAQEFEGLLLAELWKESGSDISAPFGESSSAESETMNSLAIETMSAALAQRGGLGIARMLMHQLEPSLHREARDTGSGKIKAASSA